MWVVVDQGASSLTNFTATVLVARSVDAQAFGAFGLAFVVYLLALGVERGLVAQPLAIRVSALPSQRDEAACAAGAALSIGAAFGLGIAASGLALGGRTGAVLVALAVFLPGLLLQDAWRFVFFTTAEPCLAAKNDLVWLMAQTGLMGGIILTRQASAAALTTAWGGAALLAAIYGVRQSGLRPEIRRGGAFILHHLDLGVRFAAEFLFQSGSTLLTMLVIGLVVGTAGLGAIRGSQTLFGPFYVLMAGLMAAAVPEGSRLLARRPESLAPALRAMSAGLMSVAVCWGLALLALPGRWGEAALGDTWPTARELIPGMLVIMAAYGAASGGLVGLRVLGAAGSSLRVWIVAGSASSTVGVLGGVLGGVRGGVWGLTVGPCLTCLGAWAMLRRSMAARHEPARLVVCDAPDVERDHGTSLRATELS
jgi:O-antigen/teichoic acid export membrane protein